MKAGMEEGEVEPPVEPPVRRKAKTKIGNKTKKKKKTKTTSKFPDGEEGLQVRVSLIQNLYILPRTKIYIYIFFFLFGTIKKNFLSFFFPILLPCLYSDRSSRLLRSVSTRRRDNIVRHLPESISLGVFGARIGGNAGRKMELSSLRRRRYYCRYLP